MSKNPIVNAVSASAYIGLVVTIINLLSKTRGNGPDGPFAPVVFLSLLTLSVSVMAYLFFYQPVQLFMASKKKEALTLFARTVGVFAAITALALALLFLKVI